MSEKSSAPSPCALDFRLLGPFEVVAADGAVVSVGRAERSLLALLLLNPGKVLPSSRIIHLLWEEEQIPRDPANALQTRVSKVRRTLAQLPGDAPRLTTTPGGYRLDVPRAAVDVHRFSDLVAEARHRVVESPAEAEHALEQALGLWRGPAFSGLENAPWTEPEARRLDDLRVSAAEERLSLAIAAGRAREVIDPIRSLVDDQPTHEGLTALLMRALYLSGRQADALDAYHRLRQVLDDELGLEPSAHLRVLESQILRQDPALGEPQGAHSQLPVAASTPRQAPAPGRSDPGTSARVRAPRGTSLPHRLNSFVGRDADLAVVADLLDRFRLVSLVGPGGAGKTSLGVEAARSVQARFPDGIRLVQLAGVTDAAFLPQAFADGLGVPAEGAGESRGSLDSVLDYVEDKRMLLVVDNCEHLSEPAATVVEQVLQRSVDAKVLTTSREALAISGEVQFRVQPLDLPEKDDQPSRIRDFGATQLFLDRMAAVQPTLTPTEDDERTITAICRALDGMPLAIELAAARTTSLSLNEIATRLTDRFALLTQGPRTAEERQRTLKATVDWSFELLTATERSLLRRLSVFRGGWPLQGAEQVVSGDGIERDSVLDALHRLVQRSLVVPVPGDHTRFLLLETVQAYAAEKLREAGEHDTYARRHAEWVTDLAEESELRLRGREQREWLALMGRETDNIRAALQWALDAAGTEPDLALRLGGSLGWFFHLGRHVEGREVLRRVIEVSGGTAHARARALQAQSIVERPRACLVHPSPRCATAAAESLELFDGDAYRAALSRCLLAVEGVASMPTERALELLGEASAEFERRDDRWGHALVAFVRLTIEIKHGRPEGARHHGTVATELFRELDDGWGLSAALFHLGLGLRQFGLYEEAIETFQEAIDIAAPLGLHSTVQWALSAAGIAAVAQDQLPRASEFFRSAARVRSEVGDGAGDVHAALGRGLVARARGEFDDAFEHYRVAVHGYRRLGTPVPVASALGGVARCLLEQQRPDEAEAVIDEVHEIATRLDDSLVHAWAHEARAHLAVARGDHPGAWAALDEADRLRAAAYVQRLGFEAREVAQLRDRIAARVVSAPAAGRD
ncbi:AfsR/SARP family transcriptional regulator [Nocardioides antri]|uniref:Tetratricopeptide repeat protein n=1 Tax=Nocardioides antri TaxID=2607659 RepID=A0A5B1M6Q5_9ACTN|nr:BTAD domain-containing putative transcriptional regulator [Nocardioides antri]KAA1427400.1 tetratricopeptide repeat protein [Nocardioides antri]